MPYCAMHWPGLLLCDALSNAPCNAPRNPRRLGPADWWRRASWRVLCGLRGERAASVSLETSSTELWKWPALEGPEGPATPAAHTAHAARAAHAVKLSTPPEPPRPLPATAARHQRRVVMSTLVVPLRSYPPPPLPPRCASSSLAAAAAHESAAAPPAAPPAVPAAERPSCPFASSYERSAGLQGYSPRDAAAAPPGAEGAAAAWEGGTLHVAVPALRRCSTAKVPLLKAAVVGTHRTRGPLACSGHPPAPERRALAAWPPKRGCGGALMPGPSRRLAPLFSPFRRRALSLRWHGHLEWHPFTTA